MTAITGTNTAQEMLALARSNSLQYTANVFDTGAEGVAASDASGTSSFEDALLKAIDGVSADQQESSSLVEKMLVAPDSVDAHQVTVAMAEASLSLNLARTIMDRIVRGWKEVINTR